MQEQRFLKRKLRQLEVKLLDTLATCESNIIEDDLVSSVLKTTKSEADLVMEKAREAEDALVEVEKTRESYSPLARAAAVWLCTFVGFSSYSLYTHIQLLITY